MNVCIYILIPHFSKNGTDFQSSILPQKINTFLLKVQLCISFRTKLEDLWQLNSLIGLSVQKLVWIMPQKPDLSMEWIMITHIMKILGEKTMVTYIMRIF